MFYSDRPINSGNEDKLNRKGFARLLARTLVNLDSKDTFTVGLFGKWGCGKTSLVNMTLEEIENIQAEDELKKEIIIVHFEPWNFTDTNQLLTQFFIRLANEFQKKGDKSLTKIGKALENYSDAFGLFELLPGVGAPIAAVGKWGFSRLGQKIQKGLDELDVLKQKNQVIQLLSAQSNRVLVVLDDIDRLNNEQIRYIFQLITSVARFPNMTYLLVFDKEIVVEALKDVQSGNGQDYLEKVIQMPIQIPNIQRSDLHNFLFEQLDKIIIDFKDLGYNQKHWQQLFQSCVDPFITHLRDINRLCNALRFKLTGISSEIDFADMLAISILEIQHPLVYNWAKNNKSILTGENDYSTLGVDKTQKEWLMHYTEIFYKLLSSERLNTSTEYETELVVRLLADLFPYFGQRVGKSYEIYDRNQLNRNNQIAHPDKFDRYFQLDIDSIAYKTADILNVIHNFDEHDIITFLLKQEENGTSYEFFLIIGRAQVNVFSTGDIFLIGILSILIALKAGILEEILFRGFIMRLLESKWNKYIAVLVPSVLFSFAHLPSMETFTIGGVFLLIISGTLVGTMFSLASYAGNSIGNNILMHTVWNFAIVTDILHITTSEGAYGEPIFQLIIPSDSILLTGAGFGIEASLIAIIGYTLACLTLAFIYRRNHVGILEG